MHRATPIVKADPCEQEPGVVTLILQLQHNQFLEGQLPLKCLLTCCLDPTWFNSGQ